MRNNEQIVDTVEGRALLGIRLLPCLESRATDGIPFSPSYKPCLSKSPIPCTPITFVFLGRQMLSFYSQSTDLISTNSTSRGTHIALY
jgi:hypothetical protein